MPERQQKPKPAPQETEQVEDLPETQESDALEGLDDLLDEIDELLESDAQEFVSGFVQKGGE